MNMENGEEPPCKGCTHPDVELVPENQQAVELWALLDAHGRDYAGMDGWPLPLKIRDVRSECDRTADPVGLFDGVMLLEKMIYPVRYKRK